MRKVSLLTLIALALAFAVGLDRPQQTGAQEPPRPFVDPGLLGAAICHAEYENQLNTFFRNEWDFQVRQSQFTATERWQGLDNAIRRERDLERETRLVNPYRRAVEARSEAQAVAARISFMPRDRDLRDLMQSSSRADEASKLTRSPVAVVVQSRPAYEAPAHPPNPSYDIYPSVEAYSSHQGYHEDHTSYDVAPSPKPETTKDELVEKWEADARVREKAILDQYNRQFNKEPAKGPEPAKSPQLKGPDLWPNNNFDNSRKPSNSSSPTSSNSSPLSPVAAASGSLLACAFILGAGRQARRSARRNRLRVEWRELSARPAVQWRELPRN
jgi:hypothetical protein